MDSLLEINSTFPRNMTEALITTQYPTLLKVISFCNAYFIPVIIVIGILGNIISLVVFIGSKFRKISTAVYLAAMAFSDIGFLITAGLTWLESMGVNIFQLPGMCHIFIYLAYLFGFTSVWFITLLTVEVFIAIFYSQKAANICTVKTARKIVCITTFCGFLIYLFTFWTSDTTRIQNHVFCITRINARDALIGISLTDTFLSFLLPFSLIVYTFTKILVNSIFQRTLSEQDRPTVSGGGSGKAQRKMVKMLLTTIMVFLLLNLPSHALRLQAYIRSIISVSYTTSEIEHLIQQILQILYYLNFGCNFFIYNICSKKFRQILLNFAFPCEVSMRVPTRVPDRQEQPRPHNIIRNENSYLVEIHLSQIHWSELPSLQEEFVAKSPRCYIRIDENDRETPVVGVYT